MGEKRMTMEELLALAKNIARKSLHDDRDVAAQRLADAVLDLLGESAPCGWEQPVIANDRNVPPSFYVEVPSTWCAMVSPSDARAMARMLLVAADEAEELEPTP